MSQLFRQNPFLRIALFFGIGVYLLKDPILFKVQLLACMIGFFITRLVKTKIFISAFLAGVLILMGSAQQFLIQPNQKKAFICSEPTQTFKANSLTTKNNPLFQGFTQNHNSDQAGLMVALLVGDTQYIESSTKQQYKALGLSHLLAVSGMHIGLIFQVIIILLQITTGNRFPKLIVILGLILIWGYAHIGQYSPSLLRACIMFTAIHIGQIIHQKSGALNALGISFVVMLILQPELQYHWGFILSHLAVLGIILHHRRWQCITEQMRAWKRWMMQSLVITWGAQMYTSIFLLPLTLCIPTYFLLSNFILVPYFSILLFTCFGEWLLKISMPAFPFHIINQLLFKGLEYVLQALGKLPNQQIQLHSQWWLVLIAILSLVIFYYLLLEFNWRKSILWGLLSINLITAIGTVSIVFSRPEIHLWRSKNQKRRLWSHQSQGHCSDEKFSPSIFLVQKGVENQQSP
jgi:ComEC/Rec2-related protein